MAPIRVILLGTTHPHIFHRYKYLSSKTDVEVLGYYEKDEDISKKMESLAGCDRFTSMDELLSLKFDAAIIHGFDRENAYFIRKAIEAGAKGIFVEKPGVGQPADFIPLAAEITSKRIVFEVGWELHYAETVRLARQIVHDKVLGNITTARFHGGCPGGAAAEIWQSDPSNIGGFFYSLGGHSVETVVDLFGAPQRTVASIRKLPELLPHTGYAWMPSLFGQPEYKPKKAIGSVTHEDIASAILEYESFNVTLDFTGWEPNQYCEEWSIDIYGTNGALHLVPDPPSGTLLLREATGNWKEGRNPLFAGDDGTMKLHGAFQIQMQGFFDRIRGKKIDDPPCDEKILAPLLKLYAAMYKSTATNSWETVE